MITKKSPNSSDREMIKLGYQLCFKHFKYLLERNIDHSARSIFTSGLYFLPQYTVIDSVLSDTTANYDVCLFKGKGFP